MRRQAVIAAAAALLAVSSPAAHAQPMMGQGGGMPDLSRIVGRPLPVPGMPKGTISVRVARKLPVNAAAGVEVSAIIKNAGGDLRKRTLTTDDTGHVTFEGIQAGDEFKAEANVDGEHLQTEAFTMPAEGGLKTMLISGLAGGGGGGDDSEGGTAAGAPAGKSDQRAFALGATVGSATPDDALPLGTLDVRLRDENDAPIANHPVLIGMVNKQGSIETRRATSDAGGQARFTGLPVGKETGYAAVIEWHGLRLNTAPFAMPENGGAVATIRALARTADPSTITIGAGGRIVVQFFEDRLQILEFLPLENTSDKMFDPSPGAFEIPLPQGFVGAQPTPENDRKIEVRQNHGVAVHGAIVPKRAQLATPDAEREQEVAFWFVLPHRDDTYVFSQPAPNGIGDVTLFVDQKVEGLSASGPGVGPRQERVINGHKYWVMPVAGVQRGGALTFTLTGVPATDSSGRIVAGIIALVLVISAVAFARRPQSGRGAKPRIAAEERARLVDKREALFGELVLLERTARLGDNPVPADQRRQLVGRLEQVYQDIAALDEDEPRAA